MFKVVTGIFQAWWLLGKVKPGVVFLKGGYVGVPMGLAAAARRIPIVTHDSDTVPGLANRLVGRWASVHATALPAEYYKYLPSKVSAVGVLVEHDYQPVDDEAQRQFKKQLDISEGSPLLLITGGSSGAERINKAVVGIIDKLLLKNETLYIIHQVGQGKAEIYDGYKHDRLRIIEFMKPMHIYTAAADLIVTRAGANALAEFGVQGKACIVIPNQDLTGGHQIKNAKRLEEQGAAIVLTEEMLYDPHHGLLSTIDLLLNDETKRRQLAKILQSTTISDAARKLAIILIDQAKASGAS